MPCCAAVNCSNRQEKGFRLFNFPRDKVRCALWLSKVKRDNWKPTSYSALCEAHFNGNQFEKNRQDGWKKLRPDAVPTLFSHRKLPLIRSPEVSPTKSVAKKRSRVELGCSNKSFPDSSATTSVAATASSEAQLPSSGKKSNDKNHPDYTPSIFPHTTTTEEVLWRKIERFEGAKKRVAIKTEPIIHEKRCKHSVDDIESGTEEATNEHKLLWARQLNCMASGKEHMYGLAKVLYQFQQTGYLCDTVLVAEDGMVKVHSAVLAATSPVFRASLKAGNKPQQHVLMFPGIELFIVNCVVRFIYAGEIVLPDSKIWRLPEILATLRELGLEVSRPTEPCSNGQGEETAVTIQNGSSQFKSMSNYSQQISSNSTATATSWSTICCTPQNVQQAVKISGNITNSNVPVASNSVNLVESATLASAMALPNSHSKKPYNLYSLSPISSSVLSTAPSAIQPISSTSSRGKQSPEMLPSLSEDCRQPMAAKVTVATKYPVAVVDHNASETVPVLGVSGTVTPCTWPVLASTCLVFYRPPAILGSLMSTAIVAEVSPSPSTSTTSSALKSFCSIRPAITPAGVQPRLSASTSTAISSVSLAAPSFANNYTWCNSSSAAPLSCMKDELRIMHADVTEHLFRGHGITEDVAQCYQRGELSASELFDLRRRGLISPWAGVSRIGESVEFDTPDAAAASRCSVGPRPDGREVYCSSCGFNHSQEFVHKMRGTQLCEFCGLISPTCGLHLTHVALHRHDVIKPRFSCEFCSKTFAFENGLNVHIRCHSAAGPSTYVCDKCGKVYSTDAARRHHMLVRHGVEYVSGRCKPAAACHICKRRFRCPANLRQHMRAHTGERPFACAVCPMRFMTQQVLKVHSNSHSGATPYTCRECGRAFAQPSNYCAHMKRFHKGSKASLTGTCVSELSV